MLCYRVDSVIAKKREGIFIMSPMAEEAFSLNMTITNKTSRDSMVSWQANPPPACCCWAHLYQQSRLSEINLGNTAIQGDGYLLKVLQVVFQARCDINVPILGQVPYLHFPPIDSIIRNIRKNRSSSTQLQRKRLVVLLPPSVRTMIHDTHQPQTAFSGVTSILPKYHT